MSMTVEILINGLAICFQKDNVWNVVFICDDVHPINFKVDNVVHAQSPLRKPGKVRSISFNIGTSPNLPPAKGSAFNNIFNMAANYAHGPGKLNIASSGTTDKISMKIPSATLDTESLTRNKYFVQNADVKGDPPLIINEIADIISATFHITDEVNGLIMTIKEEGAADINIPFPFKEGTLTLTFDNDCGNDCRGNDFIQLYDFVRATDGKRFVAGQVRAGSALLFSDPRRVENFSMKFVPFSSLNGNCDPAAIDPPPGIGP